MSSFRSHQHPARSQRGLRRCLGLSLGLGLLLVGGFACRRQPPPPPQTQQGLRQHQQARQAAQQCLRRREALRSRLDQLRQHARELVRLRGAVPPDAGPRPIWDEAKERRYSRADQELDRQAYERELQAWRDTQAAFQASWLRSHAIRVAAAQSRLNRLAAELRQEHPQLFSGSTSIEVDPTALQQLSRCPPLPT